MLHPIANCGLDRKVLGSSRHDRRGAGREGRSRIDFGDLDLGFPGEVLVVREAVGEVGPKGGEDRRDDVADAGGPKMRSVVRDSVRTQWVVMTSLRSVMWSLWRCVTNTASGIGFPVPTG